MDNKETTAANATVLVLGATGRQGGAVARELLRRKRAVRALVRDVRAPAALALAEAGAHLVHADLDDPASVRAAMHGVNGVFSVQTFRGPGGVAAEERQGKTVADAAAEAGVEHLVYSSVGGAERCDAIPHFRSKLAIEEHIDKLGLPATVLRPTMFYDILLDLGPRPVDGELVLGLWLRPHTPVQIIATDDIGAFAADAFDDRAAWLGRKVEITSDELTGVQIAETFGRVAGLPARYTQQSFEPLRTARPDLAAMFDWLENDGYHADLSALRRIRPHLTSLESWLRNNWTVPAS